MLHLCVTRWNDSHLKLYLILSNHDFRAKYTHMHAYIHICTWFLLRGVRHCCDLSRDMKSILLPLILLSCHQYSWHRNVSHLSNLNIPIMLPDTSQSQISRTQCTGKYKPIYFAMIAYSWVAPKSVLNTFICILWFYFHINSGSQERFIYVVFTMCACVCVCLSSSLQWFICLSS